MEQKKWLCASIWLQCSLNTNRTKLYMHMHVISVLNHCAFCTSTIFWSAHDFSHSNLAPDINTNALTSCQSMPYTYIIFQEEPQSKCAPCAWWLFLPFRTNHRIGILWCRFWLLLDALTGFHFYTDWRWLHLCKFNIITTKGDNMYFSLENCVLIWRMDVLLVEWERVQAHKTACWTTTKNKKLKRERRANKSIARSSELTERTNSRHVRKRTQLQ